MFDELKKDQAKFEKFFHYLAYRLLRDQKKCMDQDHCPIIVPSMVNTFLSELNNFIDNDEGFNKSYLPNLEPKKDEQKVPEDV